ncbi:MAG TPA: T9SS type A sorting domain-containing protein, partial [Bacteroidota bacterium]
TWNDTAHTDSIYTPVFMNAQSTSMFADASGHPGFVQSGNQNVDPGFGASIPNVLTQVTNGLLNWFTKVRTGTGTTEVYGYQITQVTNAANWTPPWPLPETADMKYTNTAVKNSATDGRPLGDPWWFNGTNGGPTGVSTQRLPIPSKFDLSEAYPNPFNPSTNIEYTLNKAGVTNLRVYNILGQVVSTLVDNVNQTAGTYKVTVDMSHVTSGVYFYVLEQGQNRIAHKMLLLK